MVSEAWGFVVAASITTKDQVYETMLPLALWIYDHPGYANWIIILGYLSCFILMGWERATGPIGRMRLAIYSSSGAVFATMYTFLLLGSPARDFWGTVSIVVSIVLAWSMAFHAIFYSFGPRLSSGAFGSVVARSWVKMIDYLYLAGSTFGILRIALSDVEVGDPVNTNIVGVIVLGIALSLRLTKTSIEIFGWDKVDGGARAAEVSPDLIEEETARR